MRAVYLLGPLSAAVCMYVVWLLGRDIVGGSQALIAVLALEGLHFFNFSVPKFAHDQMQLPFWALTGLFLYRAIARERALDWLAAGAALALCFWSKYAAFALAGSLGLFMLLDPAARRSLLTPGPWLMALAFLLVIAPNLYWLVDTGFLPLRYVDARAKMATHWYHFVSFPLQWSASQLGYLAPTIALMGLALWGGRERAPADEGSFARRYVTMLALGPFALTTLLALVLGRLPVAMWGYPLWSFAPLAALIWLGPVTDAVRLKRFAAGFLVIFAAMPLAYVIVEGLEPLVRDRPKATQFPGRQVAAAVTQRWREKFSTPLPYVGGGEFATNNIAVYSPDRPRVIVHANVDISPWIDRLDLSEARCRAGVGRWTARRRGPRAPALGLSGARGTGTAGPAAPDFRRARPRAAGARARRLRAAAAVAHVPQKLGLDLIGAGYRFAKRTCARKRAYSLPTASPSISTFRSGPARPAITR